MPKITNNSGKYSELSKEQLIKEIKQLKKRKKFGLVWEDKLEDVAEMCKTQLPVLKEVEEKEIVSKKSEDTNIIIEGDNYHSLSVLNYTHAGKIDVIYIDPPYNTGARDWKYNNDYVDSNDTYRHSKWLSFMYKRLILTKKLLKRNGVVIVTVDEHEVHNLGVLLKEVYPNAYIQMVTIVINPKGVTQGRFSRVEEYAFFCFFGKATVQSIGDDLLTPLSDDEKVSDKPRWKGLLRSGTNARREDRKNLFYPILIDESRGAIVDTGVPLLDDAPPDFDTKIKGLTPVWPVRTDGSLGNWGVGHTSLKKLIDQGYVSLGAHDKKRNTWSVSYLSKQAQEQIIGGTLKIVTYDEIKNVVDVRYTSDAERRIKSVWHRSKHDAGAYGADYLRKMLGSRNFPFPKSIHAVKDCLATVTKHDSLVLDFFAGSGTTGEAVLQLNKDLGGNRKFILCTNNEGGIAEEVTYERIKTVAQGYKIKDEKIKGLGGNLKYYRTDFVDQVITDGDKRKFVNHATEMLCLAENTFDRAAYNKGKYAIFLSNTQATGVVYDEDYVDDIKKELKKIKLPIVMYVFSYDNSFDEDDFSDVWGVIKVKPIPAVILNVYKRLVRVGSKRINQ